METTSVRLPEKLVRAIDRVAAQRGVRRSVVVRQALEALVEGGTAPAESPDLRRIRSLVDYPGSGVGDLGRRGEEHLRAAFHARRRRRR